MGAEFLDVTGAGITVMTSRDAGPLCVSDETVAALEDAQFTLGQGPGIEAYRTSRAVEAAHFDDRTVERWPGFCELARERGIGAAFAFPLSTDGARVGVLSLYQSTPGALTPDQQADCLLLAAVITETVLGLQDASPAGTLASEMDEAVAYRAEIYQASGIVAVQLGISPPDALVRLRAHAFAHDTPLDQVASAVVSRQLRLDGDGQEAPR